MTERERAGCDKKNLKWWQFQSRVLRKAEMEKNIQKEFTNVELFVVQMGWQFLLNYHDKDEAAIPRNLYGHKLVVA